MAALVSKAAAFDLPELPGYLMADYSARKTSEVPVCTHAVGQTCQSCNRCARHYSCWAQAKAFVSKVAEDGKQQTLPAPVETGTGQLSSEKPHMTTRVAIRAPMILYSWYPTTQQIRQSTMGMIFRDPMTSDVMGLTVAHLFNPNCIGHIAYTSVDGQGLEETAKSGLPLQLVSIGRVVNCDPVHDFAVIKIDVDSSYKSASNTLDKLNETNSLDLVNFPEFLRRIIRRARQSFRFCRPQYK